VFEELVAEALEGLPDQFLARLENVGVIVEVEPGPEQLAEQGLGPDETLFGLYEGVPLTAREDYGNVLPDKITIFQRPLEEYCETAEEIVEQVRVTVAHEVAHFFGIDDEALHDMGLG
jgi:predicted Zn-dependent protease with MMP-like domain